MLNKYRRIFNTVKYLTLTQIYYRIFYTIRKKLRRLTGHKYVYVIDSKRAHLYMLPSIAANKCYDYDGIFTFLNLPFRFCDVIDWNYSDLGKLWTYNLTYFDYLNQNDMTREAGLALIKQFVSDIDKIKDGSEPFPISLRAVNWIKFLSYNHIQNKTIDDSLLAQYGILLDNLEYHILGNHLLENAFSLLFGAYYFTNDIMRKKASELLLTELDRQILDDGAHFELSPMYHQIMLFRVLDCVNLLTNTSNKDQKLLEFLQDKASVMLGWLCQMTYSDGSIPMLNDCARDIAPTTAELVKYAATLGIHAECRPLSDSGYRKIVRDRYELLLDVGHIGPDYQPGHAHSDMLSFELRVSGYPVFVDTGISTYNVCDRRRIERSTCSHNTVELENSNQCDVWGGFRVGARGYANVIEESELHVKASHNGYQKRYGVIHERTWDCSESMIIIHDIIQHGGTEKSTARFHLAPTISIINIESGFLIGDLVELIFAGASDFTVNDYLYSEGYNTISKAQVIEVNFTHELSSKFVFKTN